MLEIIVVPRSCSRPLPVLIIAVHDFVTEHVRREIARNAFLPVWYLERGGVAPWLEREFLVDHACEAARPLQPWKSGHGRLNETGTDQVRATDNGRRVRSWDR